MKKIILLSGILILLFPMSTVLACWRPSPNPINNGSDCIFPLKCGLTGWWPFSEGSGSFTLDDVADNDAYVFNAKWSIATIANLNNCFYFDGSNDYLKVDSFPKLQTFTISVWVNFDEILGSSQRDFATIVAMEAGQGSKKGWGLFANFEDNQKVTARISNGYISQTWDCESLTPENYAVGWHHIALTSDGCSLKYYRDGTLINTHAQDLNNTGEPSALYFGMGKPLDIEYSFRGYLDEIRIYDSALNQSQVETLSSCCLPWDLICVPCEPCVPCGGCESCTGEECDDCSDDCCDETPDGDGSGADGTDGTGGPNAQPGINVPLALTVVGIPTFLAVGLLLLGAARSSGRNGNTNGRQPELTVRSNKKVDAMRRTIKNSRQ